jgi:hypothetical protein
MINIIKLNEHKKGCKHLIEHTLKEWLNIQHSCERKYLRYVPVCNENNILIYNIRNGRKKK